MLSYRHAFHAGNHADVLKHVVLVRLLRHLALKDKPFWYVDTHAGPAIHALDTGYATKNAEFATGIARLWDRPDLPPAVADYVAIVRQANPDGRLAAYPGSSAIALELLRPNDRVRLFEMHPTELEELERTFADAAPRVIVKGGDGFIGLQAILPPPPRRGLVLIDPSYEDKDDYRRVLTALKGGLERFATGTYAVWYPQVQRQEARDLPAKLKRLQLKDWLHVTLTVKAPVEGGHGLHGSGMFVLNPPWTLPRDLAGCMPWLARTLGQDAAAGFTLESDLA